MIIGWMQSADPSEKRTATKLDARSVVSRYTEVIIGMAYDPATTIFLLVSGSETGANNQVTWDYTPLSQLSALL